MNSALTAVFGDPLASRCTWWLGDVLDIRDRIEVPESFRTPVQAELARALDDLADLIEATFEPYQLLQWLAEGGEVWDMLDTAEEADQYAREVAARSFESIRASCASGRREGVLRKWREASPDAHARQHRALERHAAWNEEVASAVRAHGGAARARAVPARARPATAPAPSEAPAPQRPDHARWARDYRHWDTLATWMHDRVEFDDAERGLCSKIVTCLKQRSVEFIDEEEARTARRFLDRAIRLGFDPQPPTPPPPEPVPSRRRWWQRRARSDD